VQGTADPEIKAKFKDAFAIWINNITEVLKKDPCFEENKCTHYSMLP
jgi:hypothetical protein